MLMPKIKVNYSIFQIYYSLIKPNLSFSEISSIETNTSYLIFSAVVDKYGRFSMLKREGVLPLWIPENRYYNIKTQFLHYNDSKMDRVVGVFTWKQTGGKVQEHKGSGSELYRLKSLICQSSKRACS